MSGPSYGVLGSTIFASSPVSFTLFWLPSLVRARVPSDAQVSGEGICPPGCHESLHILIVMYTILQLLISSFQEGMAINLPLLCNVS